MPYRAIYYDTETTGRDPHNDRIVELAAFDPVQNLAFQSFIHPEMPIPIGAQNIHGISDEMVKDAPRFREVGQQFFEFCGPDAVLIAHNNFAFDALFLQAESRRADLALPAFPMVDSLLWSRKYRPDLPKHSLQFLRRVFGVAENQAHRALDDAKVLSQIFTLMIDDLPIEQVLHLMKHSPDA